MSTQDADLLAVLDPLAGSDAPSHSQFALDDFRHIPEMDSSQVNARHTRTYRGGSLEELAPRIERDLGADAIILRRREGLTGGLLGFFQRSFVEIEAVAGGPRIDVYDEDQRPAMPERFAGLQSPDGYEQRPSTTAPLESARRMTPHGAYVSEQLAALAMASRDEATHNHPRDVISPAEGLRPPTPRAEGPHPTTEGLRPPTRRAEGPHAPTPRAEDFRGSSLPPTGGFLEPAPRSREFHDLTTRPEATREPKPPTEGFREDPIPHASDFLEPVSEHVFDSFAATLAAAESSAGQSQPRTPPERWTVPPPSRVRKRAGVSIEKRLLSFGISERFARELIEGASAHVLPLAPGGGLNRCVQAALAQRIPVAPPLPIRGAAIAVVGAGGSGKTSYCVAMLQAYRKNGVLPASYAALTWDPERAGLNMLLSPHVMTPSPIDAPRSLRALRRVRGEGLAVVDTPHLSRADRGGIRELARLFGELAPERVVVALPATLGATAAAQLLDALSPLGANSLVVTHADETDQIGVAVEAACTFGLAPEYLVNRNRSGGWRVGRMDPSGLAARLLR